MEKKILNVGVISCSGMAEGHMKGVIAHPQAKLVAVCDIDLEKAKTVAERRGVSRVYQDYKELLAFVNISRSSLTILLYEESFCTLISSLFQPAKAISMIKPLSYISSLPFSA